MKRNMRLKNRNRFYYKVMKLRLVKTSNDVEKKLLTMVERDKYSMRGTRGMLVCFVIGLNSIENNETIVRQLFDYLDDYSDQTIHFLVIGYNDKGEYISGEDSAVTKWLERKTGWTYSKPELLFMRFDLVGSRVYLRRMNYVEYYIKECIDVFETDDIKHLLVFIVNLVKKTSIYDKKCILYYLKKELKNRDKRMMIRKETGRLFAIVKDIIIAELT